MRTSEACLPDFILTDNWLVAARNPEHLQLAFDLLTDLFDRVNLKTNTLKTKAMVFLPGRIRTCLSEEAYYAMMNPLAKASSKEQQVRCQLCQQELKATSLVSHLKL